MNDDDSFVKSLNKRHSSLQMHSLQETYTIPSSVGNVENRTPTSVASQGYEEEIPYPYNGNPHPQYHHQPPAPHYHPAQPQHHISDNDVLTKRAPSSWNHELNRSFPKEESNDKRNLRLLKNREAARECRRKKKEYQSCLENRVAVLENQNKALIEELKSLKELYTGKQQYRVLNPKI